MKFITLLVTVLLILFSSIWCSKGRENSENILPGKGGHGAKGKASHPFMKKVEVKDQPKGKGKGEKTQKHVNKNEILNPAETAIRVQALIYYVEEFMGEQKAVREITSLLKGINLEKERLIRADMKNQGVPLPEDKKKKAKPKPKPKPKPKGKGKGKGKKGKGKKGKGKGKHKKKCKYVMSAAAKKKIEELAQKHVKSAISKILKLLDLKGPQTIMIKLMLIKEPLQNLEKQSPKLITEFLKNLAHNLA